MTVPVPATPTVSASLRSGRVSLPDPFDVFSAIYAIEDGSPPWLDGLLRACGPALDQGAGGAIGLWAVELVAGTPRVVQGPWSGDEAIATRWIAAVSDLEPRSQGHLHRSVTWTTARNFARAHGLDGWPASFLWVDALIVNGLPRGVDARCRSVSLVFPSLQTIPDLGPDLVRALDLIAKHLGQAASLLAAVPPAAVAMPPIEQRSRLLSALANAPALSSPDVESVSLKRASGELQVVDTFHHDDHTYTVMIEAVRDRGGLDQLTPRERETCQLLARGLPNKLIADRLGVSVSTVGTLIGRVVAKLGCDSRVELATWARVHASELMPARRG